MAYATVQNMIDRFTEAELRQLAPLTPNVAPFHDVARIDLALADASAELDSYFSIRFSVPISEALPLVEMHTCNLAREALDRTGRVNVLEAGKRARAWAKDVAAGRASLGSGSESAPDDVPAAESGGVQVAAPDRVFTEATLAGFLR